MCETTQHHSGATQVLELPKHVGRESAALSGSSLPALSASERAAARIEVQPPVERLVFESLAGSDPVVVEARSPGRAAPKDSSSGRRSPVREEPAARPVEVRQAEPVQPEEAPRAAELPPTRPVRSTPVPQLPDRQPTESRQLSPTPPKVSAKPTPIVVPPTPSAKLPPPVAAAPKAAQKSSVDAVAARRAEAMRDVLTAAVKEQGNYSGTQKSQQPRILAWQNKVLNDLHMAIDGNRFPGRELHEGPARTASIVFIRDAVRTALGADVALPKFISK